MICVDPAHHIERLDPELALLVPADAHIIKAGALPLALTRYFGVAGDIGLRSLAHICAAIKKEMTADRPDVVMITGSPYFPMLLGGWIKRRWGIPVVLDFQDPWVTPVGASATVGTKAWLAHRLAVTFEPKAVRSASFITSVSDRQNEEMANRYSFVDAFRMAAIPIGGDPMDFSGVNLEPRPKRAESQKTCRIVYTGTVWPAAIPVLRKVLRGLEKASGSLPEGWKIEAIFIGTTANPNATSEFRVKRLAENSLVASMIKEVPERRPYLEAVRAMANADVNLIIGSLEPHYTASKIFPILMAGRPHLSVLHSASSAHTILSSAGGGMAFGFETLEELDELVPKIAQAIVALAIDPESAGKVDEAAYANFTAHAVSGRFAAIFNRLHHERLSEKYCAPVE